MLNAKTMQETITFLHQLLTSLGVLPNLLKKKKIKPMFTHNNLT